MQRQIARFIALLLVCGFWAFAQDPSQTAQTTNGGTSAGANAGSTAVINQQGATSIIPRQFPYASENLSMPFPGMPVGNGSWTLACPAFSREMGWSKEEVDNLKHHSGFANIFKPASWGKRFHVYRYSKNEGDWNGKHRILPICWSPYSTKPNPGDKILAIVDGFGEYGIPDDVSVAAALASGIPKDTGRVVVFIRTINSVQTNSHVLGASVGGAIAPNSDNKGLSAILGANFGGTNVQIKDKPEIKILCLNAGPLDPPQMPEPARPAVQQAQVQVPPPPPPPQVVKVEVDVRVEPIQIAPLPVPQALTPQPLPPAPAPQAKTCSGLPDLTVLFALDKSEVGSDYLPKIKEFATWLGNHPSCRVQVEGHTCTIGSAAYNAALGLRRAKAAYDKLIDAGGKPDQIEQKVSLGKDKPASENRPENRRTILRIVGPASGK